VEIVLSMITKNSLEKVKEFEEVWTSSLQVPYDLIILVDDSDSDKTREFVKKFAEEHNKELVIVRSRLYNWHKPTRATARQTAIDIFFQNTSAEWLFFLDDDVILRSGWWDEARIHMGDARVGLIWGIDYTDRWIKRLKYFQVRGLDYIEYSIRNFSIRGGLHDTLLRRSAIKGVELPPWLNVYEDAWIKRYVECLGYMWRVVKAGATHLRADWETGYSPLDAKISVYADAILRLQPATLGKLLKALFGLPAYLYYGLRSGSNGWDIWKSRFSYRYSLLIASNKCRFNPCEVVINYGRDPTIKRQVDNCVYNIFKDQTTKRIE